MSLYKKRSTPIRIALSVMTLSGLVLTALRRDHESRVPDLGQARFPNKVTPPKELVVYHPSIAWQTGG